MYKSAAFKKEIHFWGGSASFLQLISHLLTAPIVHSHYFALGDAIDGVIWQMLVYTPHCHRDALLSTDSLC